MRIAALWMGLAAASAAYGQANCAGLKQVKIAHVEIESAQAVDAAAGNPARCVVKAISRPTTDSEIRIEVWLPAEGWNGKYLQMGNGGWAGAVPVPSLVNGVQRGYVTAGTDDGHSNTAPGGPAGWAIGHPEKLIDFGHRALHETAVTAKALAEALYAKQPARSYFMGCSDGGREALMEAQRYPEDFDGIIAGAPANDWANLMAGFLWNEQALGKDAASTIPAEMLPAIQAAVLAQCDTLDGVKDGLLEDPRRCHFNARVLACRAGQSSGCLTAPQLETLRRIYDGPVHAKSGERLFPGYPPGHEAIPNAWRPWIINPAGESIQAMFGNSFFGQAVFERTSWDWRTLNFGSDVDLAVRKAAPVLSSTSPDLRSFRAHGGKLIQYHGWADAAISPLSSIEYYERVLAFARDYPDPRSSGPVNGFYRLFLVPGMGHCAAGAGPSSFGNDTNARRGDAERDIVTALERWVEQGIAPERLVGTGKSVADASQTLTRPLCPYPQTAVYDGRGDTNSAASFRCQAPSN